MSQRVVLSWDQKYAILLRRKSLEISGGLDGVRKVQEWSEWGFGFKKAPLYISIMKNIKNEENVIYMHTLMERIEKRICF